MSIIILFAIALFTILGLTFQLGPLALLIVPGVALFFLLAVAPALVEEMEAELARADSRARSVAPAGASKSEPAVCVDAKGGAGVLYLPER